MNTQKDNKVDSENALKGRAREVYDELLAYLEPLPSGCMIPSVKKLQEKYGAGQATIIGALKVLEEQKKIQRIPRKGIMVIKSEPEKDEKSKDSYNFLETPWISIPTKETLFAVPGALSDIWQLLVDRFNEDSPHRPVKLRTYEHCNELLARKPSENDDIVLFTTNPNCFFPHFNPIQFVNLNEVVASLDPEEYHKNIFQVDHENRIWGIIPHTSCSMVIYNKQYLRLSEISDPSFDWTWEDLSSICRLLKNSEKAPCQYDYYFYSYITYLFHNGVHLINPENGRLQLDYDKMVTPIELLKKMIIDDETCPCLSDVYPHQNTYNDFLQGKIAMIGFHSQQLRAINSLQEAEFEMLPMPLRSNGFRSVFYPLLCINNSLNFDTSWQFIQFTLSVAGQNLLAEHHSNLPVRKDIRPANVTDRQYRIQLINAREGVKMPEDDFIPYTIRFGIESGIDRWIKYGGNLKDALKELEKSCQWQIDHWRIQ